MRIFGWTLLLLALLLLSQAIWALVISLRYRKGRALRTNAYLEKTEYTPKINCHSRTGLYVRCQTKARYVYRVEGKQYSIERVFDNVTPGELKRTVKVIYQPCHPSRAYLEKLTFPSEPVICGVCVFLCILFLFGAIGYL